MKYGWIAAALALFIGTPLWAQTDLKQVIGQVDQAASQKDLTTLLNYYSPEFKNGDGLDKTKLSEALTLLWKDLDQPVYRTNLLSSQAKGDLTTARTRTTITGQWKQDRFSFSLNSVVEAEGRWQKKDGTWQLLSQTILDERTELRKGSKPPQTKISVPAEVKAGKSYDLQAVLVTPLDEQLVLGGLAQSPVSQLAPATPSLDGLQAGGFFKRGTVPNNKTDQLLSLGFVKGDGMYFVTQRIRVK